MCVWYIDVSVGCLFPFGNERRMLKMFLNHSSTYCLETGSYTEPEAGCFGKAGLVAFT